MGSVASTAYLGGEGQEARADRPSVSAIEADSSGLDATCVLVRKPLPSQNRESGFQPVFGAVLVREAEPQRSQALLAFEPEIVTRACQIVGVIVQVLDGSPKSDIPIALESEVPLVGKLQHCAMCVGL